jgi:hypothetical protein
MTDTDELPGPVAFAARFPPEERFGATAGKLAARLAEACGCTPEAAEEVRGDVRRAFGDAVASAGDGGDGVEITLRAADGTFEADVTCGGRALLHCTKTRPA